MILGAMDDLYLMGQLVGKSFGLIDAHDSTIEDLHVDGGHQARLAGVEPGWPELVVDLPLEARFHQAMTGPLTRSGGWISSEPVSDLKRFFEPRLASLGGSWKATERGESFNVLSQDGLETSVRLGESPKLGTMILIRQKRTDAQLKASMKSRLRSLERWRHDQERRQR